MNTLFLMKNPELFQGEKYIKTGTNYFEGWYFKNTCNENGISFIPGINIDEDNKKAFIQIITNNSSYFVNYDINDFKFGINPFYVEIGNNFFSKNNIHIDIKDEAHNLAVFGDIKYSDNKNIYTNLLNPNIMGPFSYIPFMECNHAILSMKSTANGSITINNHQMNFTHGTSYIEKDWGFSFPKYYIWCQGNNFKNSNASFMVSIADIPFKAFNFRGIICVLMLDNIEYKFTTYNNTKLLKFSTTNDILNISLKKGPYILEINSSPSSSAKLFAPVKGKMAKDILESISASVNVTLKKDNKIIFSDTSTNCGLEIVPDN